MFSSKSPVAYHKRMNHNNTMIINDNNNRNDNSPTLSYENEQERALQVNKVAEHHNNIRIQVSRSLMKDLVLFFF